MLTAFVVFLLLLLLLLAIPISLSYRLSWQRALRGDVHIHYMFGLLRFSLPLGGDKTATKDREEQADQKRAWKKGTAKKKRSTRQRNVMGLIRNRAFRERVIRFIKDCWRAIGKDDVRFHARIGLGDPAQTGQLWAVLGPLAAMLANVKSLSFYLEPLFLEESIEVNSQGSIRLIPLQFIYLVLGVLFSPVIWQGLRQARQA